MISGTGDMQHRRLRAPRRHGTRLIDPPLASAATLVSENRSSFPADANLGGQSFQTVARRARRDLLDAARQYTGAYRDLPPPPVANDPPVAVNDTYNVDEDGTLNVSSSLGVLDNDTDPENDPLTATQASGPAHGSLTLNGDGSFDYSPHDDYNGGDSFTYNVSDGHTGGRER